MVFIDRNGANCFMLAQLAAVKKISHDDDAQHEPHALLLLLYAGVGLCVANRSKQLLDSSYANPPRANEPGGFYFAFKFT
jgi:hypothetical protein